MSAGNFNIQGLSTEQVLAARAKTGKNKFDYKKENAFFSVLKALATEPMVVLLLVTSVIYYLNGALVDAVFMACAIVLVSAISIYQDSKSRSALAKLKDFTQPYCKVIRSGQLEEIKIEDIVVGDALMVEEGTAIAADGVIVHSNDFSVNESLLTGESFSVYKDKSSEDNRIYQGTSVSSGLAIAQVTAIGKETRLAGIGKSLQTIKEEKTPLELQINNFVKKMVFAGSLVFLLVWALNYSRTFDLSDSLLKALTLAMSILPEEIPVAFTTFMAMGAWRLMKTGVVVKQMKTVETLGSSTVICVDKTGTITENKMQLAKAFVLSTGRMEEVFTDPAPELFDILETAMWASEPIPFDPMEIALHRVYTAAAPEDKRKLFRMVHEYPLEGKPPMMTHVFQSESGQRIIAAKGAPEAFYAISDLSNAQRTEIAGMVTGFAAEGYRVLAVAEAHFPGDQYPNTQQEFRFHLKGLLAFYDPPKKNMQAVFDAFYKAGISVKIVTGDTAETAIAVARQTGFKGYERFLSGDEVMQMDDLVLQKQALSVHVFSRMFPEAKLKLINSLKSAGEIVAMTGDGVNDGPALKAANIGVAMGKKGTEIAKQAASLILVEDDLSSMIDAVAMGRKIYSNLKKAIQYIISIHIPIILTVFIPVVFGWKYPNIFSPVHIIFLELVMGPTCSIVYENEPIEKNAMLQKPRPFTVTFFNYRELVTSIIQGLAITAATMLIYRYGISRGFSEGTVRTMVFTVLVASNIFLTLVNRSFYYSALTSLNYRNRLFPLIIGITIAITAILLYVPPFTGLFQFEPLSTQQLTLSILAGFAFVVWVELLKLRNRIKGSLLPADR